MCPDEEETVSAAIRIVSAYEAGVCPLLNDLWTIELSVSVFNAPDLLLGYEELARKIVQLHRPLWTPHNPSGNWRLTRRAASPIITPRP